MTEKPEELVARVRALCEAAAPPPWKHDGKFTVEWETPQGTYACRMDPCDGAFVSQARAALPRLADRLEEACRLLGGLLAKKDERDGRCAECHERLIMHRDGCARGKARAFLNGDGKETS